ncbi:MAG: hypothetical protein WC273_09030 [Dehalococcoidia bacterium]
MNTTRSFANRSSGMSDLPRGITPPPSSGGLTSAARDLLLARSSVPAPAASRVQAARQQLRDRMLAGGALGGPATTA